MASRKTTKRVRMPELSGTEDSLAIASDRMRSSPKLATASASTVMICGALAMISSAVTAAASTAGRPCDSLTNWIAAAAAAPAGLALKARTTFASATSAKMASTSCLLVSRSAIGVVASMTERKRAARGDDEARCRRRAQLCKLGKPARIDAFDR